jgi:hypothetical protein
MLGCQQKKNSSSPSLYIHFQRCKVPQSFLDIFISLKLHNFQYFLSIIYHNFRIILFLLVNFGSKALAWNCIYLPLQIHTVLSDNRSQGLSETRTYITEEGNWEYQRVKLERKEEGKKTKYWNVNKMWTHMKRDTNKNIGLV